MDRAAADNAFTNVLANRTGPLGRRQPPTMCTPVRRAYGTQTHTSAYQDPI